MNSEYPDASGVIVYPIAALEDVPRLVRGMASHGIKSGTPKEQRTRFLLVYHNEAELKMAADFSAPDDAYILLLDRSGAIRWRFHGGYRQCFDAAPDRTARWGIGLFRSRYERRV